MSRASFDEETRKYSFIRTLKISGFEDRDREYDEQIFDIIDMDIPLDEQTKLISKVESSRAK